MAAAASARTSAAGSWMSGATSSVPGVGRDPGQAADAAQAHGVVGVDEPVLPGLAVVVADRDQGVARELAHRRVAQPLEQRPGRARLAQPAEGDGGGAPVARVLVRQHAQQVRDEVLVAQRGLHLRVEAVAGAGRPLLDLDHGPDRRVAQRRVGVAQVRRDARQAVAVADEAERLERRAAQQLVAEQLDRAGAARGSPISPSACSAGYCSQGSSRSASTRRGTASREPICPRLVAAAWRTFTSGSDSAATSAVTALGSLIVPSMTAAKRRTSSSASRSSASSAGAADGPSRT